MADMSFTHADSARAALRAIVSDPDLGPAALSNPRVMANLLKDYLPDAPRETGLLLAAAEAALAESLSEKFSAGMDAASAIRLTASSLAASTVIEPHACEWVAREFAVALGLITPDTADALTAPYTPTAEDALAGQVAPPVPAAPVSAAPVPAAPEAMPQYSPPPVQGPGPGPTWPTAAPTAVPAGGVPADPSLRRRRIWIVAVLTAAALVAAAIGIAVSGVLNSAPPVQSLSSIIAPFASGCGPADQSFTLSGTTSGYLCHQTSATGVDVLAYQFDSSASYQAGLAALNTHTGFLTAGASRSCPPASGSTTGWVRWSSTHSETYSPRPGQILECYTDMHNHLPVLLWTLPGERAILLADDGASGATLGTLVGWWTGIGF